MVLCLFNVVTGPDFSCTQRDSDVFCCLWCRTSCSVKWFPWHSGLNRFIGGRLFGVLQEEYIYVFAGYFLGENTDYAMRYAHYGTNVYCRKNAQNTLLEKGCYIAIWGNKIDMDRFCCASSGLKLTWNVHVTAPQQNPTLPWPDFHFNANWDRRTSKPQLRWSFP